MPNDGYSEKAKALYKALLELAKKDGANFSAIQQHSSIDEQELMKMLAVLGILQEIEVTEWTLEKKRQIAAVKLTEFGIANARMVTLIDTEVKGVLE